MSTERDRSISSAAMRTEPLQNVKDFCGKCTVLDAVYQTGGKDMDALAALRLACTKCKYGKRGIFKADAIYTALQKELPKTKNNLTPGRKATAGKTYGKVVRSLRNEGRSLRGIADAVGICVNTVRGILKSDQ